MVLLLGSESAAFGQQYFNNRYSNNNTPYSSAALSVLPTDSGYVTWGTGYDYPTFGYQAAMVRFLNPDGRQRRVRYFERAGQDLYGNYYQQGLLALPTGGFVAVGTVDFRSVGPFGSGAPMLWRFTATGDTLWRGGM